MIKFFLFTGVTASVLSSSSVLAAIPQVSTPSRLTTEALSMPLENRVSLLKGQGPEGYRNLVRLMDDEKQTMEMRWRAVTALGRLGGKESRPELERALTNKAWYLRNAGLIAMIQADRDSAVSWARKLLSDKALMVRTAAVEVLATLRDSEASPILWSKLYSRENFRGRQSLFIRRKIVESLAILESRGSEARFIQILQDADVSLYEPAMAALERLTEKKWGRAKETASSKRERWLAWSREKTRS